LAKERSKKRVQTKPLAYLLDQTFFDQVGKNRCGRLLSQELFNRSQIDLRRHRGDE
jgi:hypothetical protein